jgi:RES domain-containing protein
MKLWRVAHEQFADLTGIGGLHRPGRWHNVGRPIVYAAEHSALAMLEVRVHMDLQAAQLSKFVMMKLNMPDHVPVDFIDVEPQEESATRALGDQWLLSSAKCVCRVRSALAPEAFNYLINPLHPDSGRLVIEAIAPLVFDARLFQ